MAPLLAFYYGSHPDDRGRFLAEIVKQDDLWFEITHDYIQWLFPTTEYSRVNHSAPILTQTEIRAFNEDELLRMPMHVAFVRMLRFFGLSLVRGTVEKGDNWDKRKSDWFTEHTHNSLRITRILKSLSTLGQLGDAQSFFIALEGLILESPECAIPENTLVFWRSAVPLAA